MGVQAKDAPGCVNPRISPGLRARNRAPWARNSASPRKPQSTPTATIPAGARDMSGRIMDYEEGADLMREPDADGGAYKRWPGVVSLPLRGPRLPSPLTPETPRTLDR